MSPTVFRMPLSFPTLLEFLPRWMVNFVKCLLFIYWDNYILFKSQNMLNYINSQILISLLFLGWAPCVMMYYLFWIEYDENWLRTFSSVFLITLFCGSPLLFFFFFFKLLSAFDVYVMISSLHVFRSTWISMGGCHRLVSPLSVFYCSLMMPSGLKFTFCKRFSNSSVSFMERALLSLNKLC